MGLGDVVDTSSIAQNIFAIDGITGIETVNGNVSVSNLSFVVWNPSYRREDNIVVNRNYKLNDFEFAYFYEIANIANKITIQRL